MHLGDRENNFQLLQKKKKSPQREKRKCSLFSEEQNKNKGSKIYSIFLVTEHIFQAQHNVPVVNGLATL